MKQEAETILKFMEFSSKLKSQLRTIKLSENRHESVADHSWQLALMILLVYPNLKEKPDLLKTLKMALVHDLAEAEIGDTPYGHTALNQSIRAEKDTKEKQEIEKVKNLIGGALGQEFSGLWYEYKARESIEAKLVKAIDSLEANFQSTRFDVSYWDNYFYKVALGKAEKLCDHEDVLIELNNAINERLEDSYKAAGLDIEKIKNGYFDGSK